ADHDPLHRPPALPGHRGDRGGGERLSMTAPIRGADVSTTEEVEALGAVFRSGGRERELFELLAEARVNTVRLRTWVDPYDETGAPYMGGTNDLDATVRLARRARDNGMA